MEKGGREGGVSLMLRVVELYIESIREKKTVTCVFCGGQGLKKPLPLHLHKCIYVMNFNNEVGNYEVKNKTMISKEYWSHPNYIFLTNILSLVGLCIFNLNLMFMIIVRKDTPSFP